MGDGYVHYLDCVDGFIGIQECQNYQIVHYKYVQFIISQLYPNKAGEKTK